MHLILPYYFCQVFSELSAVWIIPEENNSIEHAFHI